VDLLTRPKINKLRYFGPLIPIYLKLLNDYPILLWIKYRLYLFLIRIKYFLLIFFKLIAFNDISPDFWLVVDFLLLLKKEIIILIILITFKNIILRDFLQLHLFLRTVQLFYDFQGWMILVFCRGLFFMQFSLLLISLWSYSIELEETNKFIILWALVA